MSHHCVRFVMPDGAWRKLVLPIGMSLPLVAQRVRRAFATGQGIEIDLSGSFCSDQCEHTVNVKPMLVPRILRECLSLINGTRLGSILQLYPRLSLETTILNAFRSAMEHTRIMLLVGIDVERCTVSVTSRPVHELKRDEKSEDPEFDRAGLRMLASFDARRVVPVMIVTCCPSSVCLFVNDLPWSDGVQCCGVCGAAVCACD